MGKIVYLDNAATAFPKAKGLSKYIANFIENESVNINRGIYESSNNLQNLVLDTREKIVKFFDCSDDIESFSKNVIFTSSITMAINMFLRGYLDKGDHIITGSMEHHAVMRTIYELCQNNDVEFSAACIDSNGFIDISDLENKIKPNTKAIIINHASNVFGTINDIRAIGEIAKKYNLVFAVDTAQTAGIVDISMRENNIDFLAFSGHKGLLALEGIGGFVVTERLSKNLKPIITGGTGSASDSYLQPSMLPDKFESGTLNLVGIASLNYSLNYLNSIGVDSIVKKERNLLSLFINEIKDLDGIEVYFANVSVDKKVPLVSISFIEKDNAKVADILSTDYGIQIRQGLHCSLQAHESIGTLNNGTIRVSFGYYNSIDEINYTVNAIKDILLSKI